MPTGKDEVDIFKLISLVKSKWKISLLLFILLASMGVSYVFLSEPTYKTSFLATSNINTNIISAEIINSIKKLTEARNYIQLSKKLNLDKTVCESISQISAKPIKGDAHLLTVEIAIKDTTKINVISNSIVNYLRQNAYSKTLINSKIKQLSLLIEGAETSILELDSLRYMLYSKVNQNTKGGDFLMVMPLGFEEEVSILEKLGKAQSELELISIFEIIEPAVIPTKPESPRKLRDSFIILLASGIIALLAPLTVDAIQFLRKI